MAEVIPISAYRRHSAVEARSETVTKQLPDSWKNQVRDAIQGTRLACAPDAGALEVLRAHVDRLRIINQSTDRWAQQVQLNVALAELQDRLDCLEHAKG